MSEITHPVTQLRRPHPAPLRAGERPVIIVEPLKKEARCKTCNGRACLGRCRFQ